jgi:putative ABC transport system substrate-binding protein
LRILEARSAEGIEEAFVRLTEQQPHALLVAGDPFFFGQRAQITGLAARHAVPTIYDWPDYAAAGGLLAYGPNLREPLQLLGSYAGAILNGARPGDLPVQQPTRFELTINLRMA